MRTRITILIFICLIVAISCNNHNKKEVFYYEDTGNIRIEKFFDENDSLIKRIEYYNRIPNAVYKFSVRYSDYDSVFYKYDNGEIFKKGKETINNKPFGEWNHYDRDGNLREIREWFVINDKIIKNKSTINRVWFIDKNGDTLAWREKHNIYEQQEFISDTLGIYNTSCDYVSLNRDTISLSDYARGVAFVFTPKLEKYNSEIRVYLPRDEDNFNFNFSNDTLIKIDVFPNLTKDTINQKWFSGYENEFRYIACFGKWFSTAGDKIIRGYIEEYAIGPFKDSDNDSITSRTFFEKKIFVKEDKKTP